MQLHLRVWAPVDKEDRKHPQSGLGSDCSKWGAWGERMPPVEGSCDAAQDSIYEVLVKGGWMMQ